VTDKPDNPIVECKKIIRPELVIGLVAPIGVDMDVVQSQIAAALRQVKYESHLVHITKIIYNMTNESRSEDKRNFEQKINFSNELRRKYNDNSILAAVAIDHIRKERVKRNKSKPNYEKGKKNEAIDGFAFIVRQLKRKEEVDLLKKTYGKKFILMSIALDKESRINNLKNRKAHEEPRLSIEECESTASKLVYIDENEKLDEYGQRISDIFHLSDVFIDGINEIKIKNTVQRFINALRLIPLSKVSQDVVLADEGRSGLPRA
jgi:hypothetical protein